MQFPTENKCKIREIRENFIIMAWVNIFMAKPFLAYTSENETANIYIFPGCWWGGAVYVLN